MPALATRLDDGLRARAGPHVDLGSAGLAWARAMPAVRLAPAFAAPRVAETRAGPDGLGPGGWGRRRHRGGARRACRLPSAQVHALLAPLRALGMLAVMGVVFDRLAAVLAHAVQAAP